MKVQVLTETKIKSKKSQMTTKSVKTLTLDEIEEKMMNLACCDTNDVLTLMLNEKKMNMLEKVANMKMHRLQLKALEQVNEPIDVKPLEVVFVDSGTEEQRARLERIDNEISQKYKNEA